MSSMKDLPHCPPEDVGMSSARLKTALEAATRVRSHTARDCRLLLTTLALLRPLAWRLGCSLVYSPHRLSASGVRRRWLQAELTRSRGPLRQGHLRRLLRVHGSRVEDTHPRGCHLSPGLHVSFTAFTAGHLSAQVLVIYGSILRDCLQLLQDEADHLRRRHDLL